MTSAVIQTDAVSCVVTLREGISAAVLTATLSDLTTKQSVWLTQVREVIKYL